MDFSIKKGETFARKVKLKLSNSEEIINKEDIKNIFITLREQPYETYPIILQKNFEDMSLDDEGYLHFSFLAEETEKLNYGKYYFDIAITLNDDFRKIKLYELEITQKTTFYNGGDISGN